MKIAIVLLIAGGMVAAMVGGCCSKQNLSTPNRICAQGVDKQAVMDAAQSVLEDMHFTIEKADANAGFISTRPLTAGQFFELWRSDTVGCYNFAEDNLHSITHIVEINITPQDSDFCILCKADTRRLSMPTREVSGATELPGVFSKSDMGLQRLTLTKAQRSASVWVDMGPDIELQAKILERIKKRIERI